MALRYPDIMIIGAPKSGTTSIFQIFAGHSMIFTPIVKEPHFFLDEIEDQKTISDPKNYQELFTAARSCQKILEASIWYYRSPDALRRVIDANSSIKLVFCVRNPVTMIPSLHGQLLHSLLEDEEDFSEAWKLAERRRTLSSRTPREALKVYTDAALYGKYFESITAMLPRDQLKIVLFEDLIRSPGAVIDELCEFFEVDPLNISDLPNANPRTTLRWKSVKRLMMDQSAVSRGLKRVTKSILGAKNYHSFVKRLVDLNSRRSTSPNLYDKIRLEIVEAYRDDVRKFQNESGTNVDCWTEFSE